jgi:8-oxo-dGTP pyrophosphatase MutT (NUDIX family)
MQAIFDLSSPLSHVFLFVTLYHSYASGIAATYAKMLSMNLQDSSEVVLTLRKRLESTARADALSLAIEDQHPQVRRAAVLLALLDYEGETHLLFIRRAATLRSHSGEIAFPGGAVEASDGSVVIAALREAQEEIGLDPARVDVLGVLPPVFTSVSNFVITPVVASLPQGSGQLHLQQSEVTELILASLRGLADPAIFHTEQWTRAGITHTVYFYEYGAYNIWGATARMLNALLEALAVV